MSKSIRNISDRYLSKNTTVLSDDVSPTTSIKIGSTQRQLKTLREVFDALVTLRYVAKSLEGREVANLMKSLNEYATHLSAEIKRLKGSGNHSEFLKMVEKKVGDLKSLYSSNRKRPQQNRYLVARDFRVDTSNPDYPEIVFEYSIKKASSGRPYNLERDAEGWMNDFEYHMKNWFLNYSTGYLQNNPIDKKTAKMVLSIPKNYR
tara:strand:+ start:71 stop:685 length:615 start_codon:yes stop_codon:yes gene_type:complete